jgi:GNAT superfamily N-acetyltransferase
MAVLPQARRQGIATALVGACGRIGDSFAILGALAVPCEISPVVTA